MGLTKSAWKLLRENKALFQGKRVLSLGNPFISTCIVDALSRSEYDAVFTQPRNSRSIFLFTEILQAQSFKIIDISGEEGADFIFDLNSAFLPDTLKDAFDIVFDGGTQEHVFDNSAFISNLNSMLRPGGLYFLDLPANGWLEHGFRQYSPTFFLRLMCNK